LARDRDHGFEVFDFPDLGSVVGAAGCEVLNVGGQEHAGYVLGMGFEMCYRHKLGFFAVLEEVPDIDASLGDVSKTPLENRDGTYRVCSSAKSRSVTSNSNAWYWDIFLRNELVRAVVLSKIPNANTAATVTADNFALIWVDHHIIDWASMRIAALYRTTPRLPDLDRAILRACNHPFPLAMERNSSYVSSVAFETKERIGIRRFDIVELDGMMTRSCKETFVGGYAEAIDLWVGMLDCAGTDSWECFPKTGED
jgi:hypothetical protein